MGDYQGVEVFAEDGSIYVGDEFEASQRTAEVRFTAIKKGALIERPFISASNIATGYRAKSKRSRFITLFHAVAKSLTNLAFASSLA